MHLCETWAAWFGSASCVLCRRRSAEHLIAHHGGRLPSYGHRNKESTKAQDRPNNAEQRRLFVCNQCPSWRVARLVGLKPYTTGLSGQPGRAGAGERPPASPPAKLFKAARQGLENRRCLSATHLTPSYLWSGGLLTRLPA
jgi:hypothetical protein